MAERRIPRPTNCGTDLRTIRTYVPVEKWGEVMDRAEKAGLSASRYLSMLIDRDELDVDGRPIWAESPAGLAEPLPGMDVKTAAA